MEVYGIQYRMNQATFEKDVFVTVRISPSYLDEIKFFDDENKRETYTMLGQELCESIDNLRYRYDKLQEKMNDSTKPDQV
jgi:hypothetical protein